MKQKDRIKYSFEKQACILVFFSFYPALPEYKHFVYFYLHFLINTMYKKHRAYIHLITSRNVKINKIDFNNCTSYIYFSISFFTSITAEFEQFKIFMKFMKFMKFITYFVNLQSERGFFFPSEFLSVNTNIQINLFISVTKYYFQFC